MKNTYSKAFKHSLAAIAVTAVLGMSTAQADTSQGFLAGKSVNEQGVVLGNVQVTIKNLQTGLTRNYTTDASGSYRFPLLPTGKYKVSATKDGHLAFEREVNVRLGDRTIVNPALQEDGTEVIQVTGTTVAMLDVASSSTGFTLDQETLARIPVARDITSVALLAPSASLGDESLVSRTPLVAIGGASAAENVFYVNGMNITDARRGLGASVVPFEMYKDFDIKTGGYSAEYGRSMGGVIVATTKSGSNDFHFGANAYFEPKSLKEESPNSLRSNGNFYRVNEVDEETSQNIDIWASGAIIEDTLFFYGLYSAQDYEWSGSPGVSTTTYQVRKQDDPFFGAKLDWYITDEHILELTYFKDSDDEVINSYVLSDELVQGEHTGVSTNEWGGKTTTLKYTGIITDDLTVSMQYGINESAGSTVPVTTDINRVIVDGVTSPNGWVANASYEETERKLFRMDVDYYWGDHTLRFGVDREEYEAFEDTSDAGPNNYTYVVDTENQNITRSIYINQGTFRTESNAYYITDTWQVTDDVVLNLGLRNDTYKSFNITGEEFISMENQIAPRLGVSWDVNGDGESKLYANFGRYFVPVPGQTNVRLGGAEINNETVYDLDGFDGSGLPILGAQQGGLIVFDDGIPNDPRSLADNDIDPMYQDEFIIGYNRNLGDNWSMGVYLVARDLGQGFEDTDVEGAFEAYFNDNFGSGCAGGNCSYVLMNPGNDLSIHIDPDRVVDSEGNEVSNGPIPEDDYLIPNSYIRLPEIERTYYGATFSLDRQWDDVWSLSAAYTWSHSYGNHEGLINSDIQQEDAGITINYDYPGLVDNSWGNLPTDKRHSLRVFGSYALTENLIVGATAQYMSGRPMNATGYFPAEADGPLEDIIATHYVDLTFYRNGEPSPRGSLGNMPSTFKIDLSAIYSTEFMGSDVTLRADVFNIFNSLTPITRYERSENFGGVEDDIHGAGRYVAGTQKDRYGSPRQYQTPRYVRLSASIAF